MSLIRIDELNGRFESEYLGKLPSDLVEKVGDSFLVEINDRYVASRSSIMRKAGRMGIPFIYNAYSSEIEAPKGHVMARIQLFRIPEPLAEEANARLEEEALDAMWVLAGY